MPCFKFSKLVRDKIVDLQMSRGVKPVYRQLEAEEHIEELIKKVIEEVKEARVCEPADLAKELADVQQALDDLIDKFGLTSSEINVAKEEKRQEAGGFGQGIFIEYIETDENDEYAAHYRKNSDRYPEF